MRDKMARSGGNFERRTTDLHSEDRTSMKLKNALLLLLAAIIWGVAFVAQSVGMEYVGPFTFNCVRSIIGGLVLIPCIMLLDSRKGRKGRLKAPGDRKMLMLGGISCGLVLCIASNFQQFGIQYTSVGKAGFITACYIVLVPIFSLILGKKCSPVVFGAVALSVAGLYLLCMSGGVQGINKGDLMLMLCAVLFTLHIMIIDFFSPVVDGVKMSCIQFFVSGIISGLGMLFFEEPELSGILAAWMPILYAGVMSCGVAYTLQIVGQKGMNPTVASLILSLESSISVIAGWVLLGQQLSRREIMGCVLMFAAIILAQVPAGKICQSMSRTCG